MNPQEFENFEEYREYLIERILIREPGIRFNPLDRINPEDYIDFPIQEIPIAKINNMPDSASAVKHGLQQMAKDGFEPDVGAFHGIRIGKKVEIPIAVKTNSDGTFSIMDGFHRAVQVFINGDKNILAFVEGGSGKTLKEFFDSNRAKN